MDDALLEIVLERLGGDPLPVEAEALLLAAFEGDQALATQLNAPPARRRARQATDVPAKDPVGAYLRSLTVKGFRGIGPAATLEVSPGPGLTLVVGRNGSGKSSFAEALEVLLTGTLMRWAPPAPAVVKGGWRCKHASGDTEISAEFLIEGSGRTTVARTWASGADLTSSTEWLQRAGDKRAPVTALGWDADLREYRPFLSHSELEAFFGKPSDLHDLLASVLGLEDLVSADKHLNAARKAREDALTDIKKGLGPLRGRLQLLAEQDERARTGLAALSGSTPAKWDTAAAKAVATGGPPAGDGDLTTLRHLAQLSLPPQAEVDAVVADVNDAATGLRDLAGTRAAQARDLAGILDAALGHHQAHGDGDCPVCGNPGALTAQWRSAAQQHRDQLRGQAATADKAFVAARAAVNRAFRLLQPAPTVLGASADTVSTLDTGVARTAWRDWIAPVAGPGYVMPDSLAAADAPTMLATLNALAQHLKAGFPALSRAVTALAGAAAEELTHRDGQWSPAAAEVAAWCNDAELAMAASQPVPSLKLARRWIADATDELRDQRLAPLADQSRAIWAELRQESNVSLGAFRLSGTNTTRRLDLDVSIDGEPGAALGTMSQGEINALALSVFLPRATMQESPFNFLVIDDPVQAMDPAKVDGLAKVLAKVAANRQVIVFTHDNRLTAAIKDLSLPATILEVTRQPRSDVTVRKCLDASKQALDDAGAVNADQKVPEAVAARVIPTLCRSAVESAFAEAYWRQQLRAGRTRTEIEDSLAGKNLRLVRIAALALLGDANEGHRITDEIGRRWGRHFGDTMRTLNQGSHQGYQGNLDFLISDGRKLVAAIETRLK
jgi:energy-coupling factor transporter ATP-binding protein EcfA2